MRHLLLCAALLVSACEKITVRECDDASHDDATQSGDVGNKDASEADGGMDEDSGAMDGMPQDAMPQDGMPQDGGADCNSAYCIDSLAASIDLANVRETVTFTPTVRANRQQLTFSGDVAEIRASRRAELPLADLGDVDITFAVDPGTGVATFVLIEVPTWFSTTTFTVRVHAQASGGPDVFAEASVTVRGNVVASGISEVYAIASDGLPAKSVNFTAGRLLSGASFVDEPEDLWMSRDGTLLLYDHGSMPPRIRRFALDGENSQLPDFQFDVAGTPIINSEHSGVGMTQLSDGRVALVDYDFTRAQKSLIHVWNEDGTFSHTINAPNPSTIWSGLASSDTGELFVMERGTAGRLIAIDSTTGVEEGVVTTDISNGYNLVWRPDGSFYVGLIGSALRVSPQGGKQMISGLPPRGASVYRYFAPFGPGRIVGAIDFGSEFENIVVIEDTEFVGLLRQANAGGTGFFTPSGIAYLD